METISSVDLVACTYSISSSSKFVSPTAELLLDADAPEVNFFTKRSSRSNLLNSLSKPAIAALRATELEDRRILLGGMGVVGIWVRR